LRVESGPTRGFGDFDQAVNIAIAKPGVPLGDSAENPRYIETLPKRGYRCHADVSVVGAEARSKGPETAAGELYLGQSLGVTSKAPG